MSLKNTMFQHQSYYYQCQLLLTNVPILILSIPTTFLIDTSQFKLIYCRLGLMIQVLLTLCFIYMDIAHFCTMGIPEALAPCPCFLLCAPLFFFFLPFPLIYFLHCFISIIRVPGNIRILPWDLCSLVLSF